jgi:hypothetical protein
MPQVGGWNLFYVFVHNFCFFILIFSVSKNVFLSSGPLLSCMSVHLYVQCMILLTGHNTLRRHLHLTGLSDRPLCRRCGAEDETSATFFVSLKLWLHSDMCI